MLQRFADWLIYDLCGLGVETHIGQALNFFVYDTTKILLLLFLISSLMGIINAYMPVERLRGFLSSKRLFGAQYFLAALFGAITPFCSCSSIPLFIGFVRGGIPLGVTLSFLITSPLINEVAVAMFAATFGWRITLIYIASGLALGTVLVIVLGQLRLAGILGGIAAIIDAEHAFDRFYAEKLGVDVNNLWISQPDNGEQALEIADQLIRSSAIDIIVIDSVAALTPKAEIEGDMGESKMGLQARLMSQALRKLTATISKTNTTCIFINQLRDKLGVMFGSPETTTGGNALKFYASVRIDIRRLGQIKDGEDILGNMTRVKVVKNKVAPPFRKTEFEILFGEGISKVGEIVDLGVLYGIIRKSGAWFSYADTKLGQGRDAAKRMIADNPELAEELEAKIMAAMKEKANA